MSSVKIKSALISVYNKEGIDPIVRELHKRNVTIFSTGGTQKHIENLNIPVVPVEDLTFYPSILGGRVKTLHPKVFGGILNRRNDVSDQEQLKKYEIPSIDLVIVDLYPFKETVKEGGTDDEIIEKIDIGGIALIRAAAKNFNDVVIIPSVDNYLSLIKLIKDQNGETTIEQRQAFAKKAFQVSSEYDKQINKWFKPSNDQVTSLRYGENPHQKGEFHGDLDSVFTKVHGKDLSYNNLLDVDAAVCLMHEFINSKPTFAILKHNNACGLSTRDTIEEAYKGALAGDPISAFGGILISNKEISEDCAENMHSLFFEVILAPSYSKKALEILKQKKNRIILIQKPFSPSKQIVRTAFNGLLIQNRDLLTETDKEFKSVTKNSPNSQEIEDLIFANKIAKHTKSNTIVLAKNQQLLASGTGQTSRVDALNQAIQKANTFKFNLNNSVMASDAFFPFPDCVEIAHKAGIKSVVHPGGSIKDQLSIDYCDSVDMKMVITGTRHFKH